MKDVTDTDMFRGTGLAMMVVGPDERIRYATPAAASIFAAQPKSLKGKAIEALLPETPLPRLLELVQPPTRDAVLRGVVGRDAKGGRVVLSVLIQPWKDEETGEPITSLILRDIRHELAAERKMQQDFRLSEKAVQTSRIGVIEYFPETDSVNVTRLWRELMELPLDSNLDVQIEWRSRVHPDDLAIALEPVRACIESGHDRAVCDYRLRSRDGTRWRWFRTGVSVAERNAEGKVTRVTGAMVDITENKEAELELARSNAQFRSAFDNAPIGKAIVGLDGAFLRVNAALCTLLGYEAADLLKTDFQTITHPDDLHEDLAKVELLLAGAIPSYRMEKRYFRKDGSLVWCLLTVGLVRDENGRPIEFISQIIDMSEIRRLNELKSEFIATVSHELRTPLTSVLGALKLISTMNTDKLSDQMQRLLYIAEENGKRLHELIDDILDFEQYSTRKATFALHRAAIVPLVEDAVLANAPLAERYNVRCRMAKADRRLSAFVDAKRFRQVMANLLSNASKFAAEGSTIEVMVTRQDQFVRVGVRNFGAGVPEAFHDRIFKPFSQAESSATRSRGGTGLGLSIVKEIVDQHGGDVGFTSEPGGWTEFWFTVSIGDPEARLAMAEQHFAAG